MVDCIYKKGKTCCLTQLICKNIENCDVSNSVKTDVPSEAIYGVREDIICKNCGNHKAYQYKGTSYPLGLSKEQILKCKEVYGKYYNKPYFSGAVGFGGTIPYICTKCGKEGLIGDGNIGLEGYEMLFKENKNPC